MAVGEGEKESLLTRFDNWFWYDNHALFENQAHLMATYCHGEEGPNGIARAVRMLCLVALVGEGLLFLYILHFNLLAFLAIALIFMTVWGYLFTLATFILGVRLMGKPAPEDGAESTRKCCKGWKWWIFLYQTSLSLEIIITIVYWVLLYPLIKNTEFLNKNRLVQWHLALIHTVPIGCLVVDYFINAVPIAPRHLSGILAIAVLYLIDNIIVVKLSGKPVYVILKWNDWASIILSAILFAFSIALFYILFFINKAKLRYFAKNR